MATSTGNSRGALFIVLGVSACVVAALIVAVTMRAAPVADAPPRAREVAPSVPPPLAKPAGRESAPPERPASAQAELARSPAEDPVRLKARGLMPRSSASDGRAPFDVMTDTQKANTKELIAAWEDVLQRNPADVEARLNLGVCLVSQVRYALIDQWNARRLDDQTVKTALRGTALVEAALQDEPTPYDACTYGGVINAIDPAMPARVAEMDEFVLAHAEWFPEYEVHNARVRNARRPEKAAGELANAVANAADHPDQVVAVFVQLANGYPDAPDTRLALAGAYATDANPVVRFMAEYVIGEALYRDKKDPTAIAHYDRMLAVQEAAYAALAAHRGHQLMIDDVYRDRFNACEVLGKKDEARATIVARYKHFLAAGRFNTSIAFIYFYAVTEVLKDDPAAALPVADVYLAAKAKSMDRGDEDWARQVAEYRAVHRAAAVVPDFLAMHLIEGTATADLNRPRMVAAAGKVWVAMQQWQSGGGAMVITPGADRAEIIKGLPATERAVAAVGERIYFGGLDGLFEVDARDLHVVRHFGRADGLPSAQVVDVCGVGDELYFTWRDGDAYGVASLNPTDGKVTTLAPTTNPPTLGEPTHDAYRVFWDAANQRVVVNDDGNPSLYRNGWWLKDGKWNTSEGGTLVAIAQGKETLTITGVPNKQWMLLNEMKVPLALAELTLAPEPAFDATRVFLPMPTGLYVVDRATGKQAWVAHQENTPCLAAVVLKEAVYVATTRGIYRYAIPAAP